ncbi:MAG: ribosome assembly factor SBDS [Euryarchaeota archaeon]|nr:ribosome assembly factor SBDS [Euryarchaeota archaeon]MEC7703887.1 ribosome assembly factor SBDS [Candidatus Thermoplasmatota archaeon]MED5487128.1 ribosome assembly factor SBDS [Candidatus Thermoplasmatota archaeon]|tara:strand:+ start:741 stop:1430 length:690 start_codon:yes stop_codon:yes gene_type:complete
MVSLDDAVVARYERAGKRYEILVDPELVAPYKLDPTEIELEDLLATDEIWHDARGGERPTEEKLVATFGTTELSECVSQILHKGSIQLTTNQRRQMIADKRQKIISEISRTAIDPRSKAPHPFTRIELALDELRWNPDPFLSVERQIKDAVNVLRPVIPLSFQTLKLAFRVSGSAYGAVQKEVRSDVIKEQWLENGDWAFVVEIPAGMKGEYLSKVAKRDPNTEVKEIN